MAPKKGKGEKPGKEDDENKEDKNDDEKKRENGKLEPGWENTGTLTCLGTGENISRKVEQTLSSSTRSGRSTCGLIG